MNKILIGLLVMVALVAAGCVQNSPTGAVVAEARQLPLPSISEGKVLEPALYHVVMENAQFGIEEAGFGASSLEIKVGDTVEWVNKDTVEHTVLFENGEVDEKAPIGGRVSHTFITPGTYKYFCSFHPGMQGIVVVRG